MNSRESALRSAIAAAPDDARPMLAFAEWLAGRGDRRSALVRAIVNRDVQLALDSLEIIAPTELQTLDTDGHIARHRFLLRQFDQSARVWPLFVADCVERVVFIFESAGRLTSDNLRESIKIARATTSNNKKIVDFEHSTDSKPGSCSLQSLAYLTVLSRHPKSGMADLVAEAPVAAVGVIGSLSREQSIEDLARLSIWTEFLDLFRGHSAGVALIQDVNVRQLSVVKAECTWQIMRLCQYTAFGEPIWEPKDQSLK